MKRGVVIQLHFYLPHVGLNQDQCFFLILSFSHLEIHHHQDDYYQINESFSHISQILQSYRFPMQITKVQRSSEITANAFLKKMCRNFRPGTSKRILIF